MAIAMESGGRFGNSLFAALEKKEMSVRELAAATDSTYEHMRKLVRGWAYPSKYILKEICKTLNLDLADMQKMVDADKMQHKFGKNAHAVFGRDPRIAEYEEIVAHLTDEQHNMFITQMKSVARMNRKQA
jgi:transcriptional regulator with XRE-family HTH domain